MNQADEHPSSGSNGDREFVELVLRYQDGTIAADDMQALARMLRESRARAAQFRDMQLRTAAIHDLLRLEAFRQPDSEHPLELGKERDNIPGRDARTHRRGFGRLLTGGAVIAALVLVAGLVSWPRFRAQPTGISGTTVASQGPDVVFSEGDRPKFFGASRPKVGDALQMECEYMLQEGIAKLQFPSGASTILEGPSIFRIVNADCLILSAGTCSVHAPPGAEGFEVLTPTMKVVDRGTRFFVSVRETCETDVQVVEGAADLYARESTAPATPTATVDPETPGLQLEEPVRLAGGEAVSTGGWLTSSLKKRLNLDTDAYRHSLPDRLVSYTASSHPNGAANELLSLTVQRRQEIFHYSVDELVPIEVTWFRSDLTPDLNGFLCGPLQQPERPQDLLEDRRLDTGLINFGGQTQPLTQRPVVEVVPGQESAGTPGLGIRFRTAVINDAGPDVVLFEIQTFSNPPDGDPFHVYSLDDRPNFKPCTVTRYDLTMDAPSSREVAPLWSHRFPFAIGSLAELQATDAPLKVDVARMHFQVIGVAFDLSDLGYAPGEQVEELFLQHATDEKGMKVDPVFIAGLPPLPAGK